MDTHNYDIPLLSSPSARTVPGVCRKGSLLFGAVLMLFLGSLSEGRATVVAAVVDDSGFDDYALLAKAGNLNINNLTVKGDSGFVGVSSLQGFNNDVFKGDVSYTTSSFGLNNNHVTGSTEKDTSIATAFSAAQTFSSTLNTFKSTQSAIGNFTNGVTIAGDGGLNVVSLNGANAQGVITLTGGANDIFYINVSSNNLNLTGVVLNGVKAENVYWNIVNGSTSNLSGDLSGTFLAYNNSTLSISNSTLSGAVFGSSLNINNVTITALPVDMTTTALVPEASSYAALGVFAAFLAGSSVLRWWKSRQREASALPLDTAAA